MNEAPIGIFDSGIGGTTVWKEICRLLPGENTIYLADSKNAPYGEKTRDAIIALSRKNTELLIAEGCKIIVVACNTATTNAIEDLRKQYKLPFIGIEPAIKPAALSSRSGTVGVLATKGTLGSGLFHNTAKNHGSGIRIIEQEGIGLVPLIEAGKASSPETADLLKKYLAPMLAARIDHLVLGCTHYPYLIPQLRAQLPPEVNIIDCGEAVARQTRNILERNGLLSTSSAAGEHWFYSNGDTAVLRAILEGHPAKKHMVSRDF